MSAKRLLTLEQVTAKSARNRASRVKGITAVIDDADPMPTYRGIERAKPSKYRNVKTTVGDQTFDSAKEAKRYGELCLMQSAGYITDLHCQPVIKCIVNGQLVCKYVADFCYLDKRDNFVLKYEDVKSEHTRKLPVYRLKKKLVKALFNVEIIEI